MYDMTHSYVCHESFKKGSDLHKIGIFNNKDVVVVMVMMMTMQYKCIFGSSFI